MDMQRLTWRRTMKMAVEKRCDCVLLGGDLFHDNVPSRDTVIRTMDMLRKYCLGDGAVRFLPSGGDTALRGVVLNVSSPLYDAALRQLALPVLLPGLQARALHLREQTSPRSGGDQREIRGDQQETAPRSRATPCALRPSPRGRRHSSRWWRWWWTTAPP